MPEVPLHPKLLHPASDFISAQLPAWLKHAGRAQIEALRASLADHWQSQQRIAAVSQQLLPLERFAVQRLEQALQSRMGLHVDLSRTLWREERRRLKVVQGDVREFESYWVTTPALQKLLQNFKAGESFFQGTALIGTERAPAGEEAVTRRIDEIVSLCRAEDVGEAYQQHLAQVLNGDFERRLAEDKRRELAVAVEMAAIKGQLTYSDLRMLRQVARGESPELPGDQRLEVGALRLLGGRVDGAMAFELSGTAAGFSGLVFNPRQLLGVLLYLPDDSQQPLRRFANWQAANHALALAMADPALQRAFSARIALDQRVGYQLLLGKRLLDAQPDLEPARVAGTGNAFAWQAAAHVQRIKADAGFLAVPTAQADATAAAERLRSLESAGQVLLNLAGLFVPAVGALLLADLARQVLGQVFEGIADWALGHQHEALEHVLQVAWTLAVNGSVAAGMHGVRSAFLEGLEPVTTEHGEQRLWNHDLAPYRERSSVLNLLALDNGLLGDGSDHWWRCDGVLYKVRCDAAGTWRLQHAERPGAFGPVLEGNGERAWRLAYERPLEWQGAPRLLVRLWPDAGALSAEQVEQVLTVADVDETHLRGMLVEGRRLPVALRDTLERFAVHARLETFLAQPVVEGADAEAWQWCIDRLAIQGQTLEQQASAIRASVKQLRGPMLDHFAARYLVEDPLRAVLQRSFPGLPDAYALDLLRTASAELRQRLAASARVPLALAEQARGVLQQARLVRLREALCLPGSDDPDLVALVFAWVRQQGVAPSELNLELREHSSTGPLLQRLFNSPEAGQQVRVMVRREGYFELFAPSGHGTAFDVAEPQGIFEVLAACLPLAFRQHHGWAGADAAQRMRTASLAWLPRDRLDLLQVLGWREARPAASRLHRLADGRVGYLLSGRAASSLMPERILRQRIRSLYPAFDADEVERYLQLLLRHSSSAYETLLHQEENFRRLDASLNRWARTVIGSARSNRALIAAEFRRAWRLDGEYVVDAYGERNGLRLTLVGVPVGELPALPANTDLGHVTELMLVGLRVQALPAGFLDCFPDLRRLDLSNNDLRTIPDGLGRLTCLRHLRLANNRIRLTQANTSALAGLPHLRTLDLSENALGTVRLQFNQLSRLRELRLFRSGLQAVPEGLEWCGLLEHVDLRNNQIATLPQVLLDAPHTLRQVLQVDGNPLPLALREQLYAPQPVPAQAPAQDPADGGARRAWLDATAEQEQVLRAGQWDNLQAEPGGESFFQLLAELTDSTDFRLARADLVRRVWTMIEAISGDTRMREDLFERAAAPRTCVDSMAHCFSQLEVRMHVLQVARDGDPLATRDARLLLAQRLFRLDQVEAFARADYLARPQEGHDVDEVEVSLAYRIGLAQRLNLLGQPRTMQFRPVAGVTQAQLDRAYRAVLAAEAGDERIRYISQRDFWVSYLRARHPQAFAQVSDGFDRAMEALDEEKQTLGSGAYKQRCDQLKSTTEQAFEALALRLTEDELNMPLPGSSQAPGPQGPLPSAT